MRLGVRIAIDAGTARIGIARCDAHGILASPVETVLNDTDYLERILLIIKENDPLEILVGLPVSLAGTDTPSTAKARELAQAIHNHCGLPVRLVDERLSTVSAQQQLHASGHSVRTGRRVIDQVAAVIILEHALDTERRTGKPPGTLITAVL